MSDFYCTKRLNVTFALGIYIKSPPCFIAKLRNDKFAVKTTHLCRPHRPPTLHLSIPNPPSPPQPLNAQNNALLHPPPPFPPPDLRHRLPPPAFLHNVLHLPLCKIPSSAFHVPSSSARREHGGGCGIRSVGVEQH